MARKKSKGKSPSFMLFDVSYEDGKITSNRRVLVELLDLSMSDSILKTAQTAIQDQDNEIAQRSGQRRAKIKSVVLA